ncbi:MAG: hypothetical protein OER85_13945, partial [Gammaproteobacteria bacterium]|nr:hypothetical protein [Gammaproteobacteria bacterium]
DAVGCIFDKCFRRSQIRKATAGSIRKQCVKVREFIHIWIMETNVSLSDNGMVINTIPMTSQGTFRRAD